MEAKSGNGQDDLLTPQEVAKMLKLKTERVLEAARTGKLRRVKYGKFVRFRQADVEAFIQQHMAKR